MNPITEDILIHYGMPRRSGRYPWGSGDDPYQHGRDFLGRVDELRKQGFTYTDEKTGKTYSGDTAIAKSMGLSTTEFRTELGIAKDERRMLLVARVKSLKEDGKGNSEIARELGLKNESSVRSLLDDKSEARMKAAQETANFLKERSKAFAEDGGMLDVGVGVERELSASRELNISKEKLNQALYILKREGWNVYPARMEQPTNPGKWTTQKVLCPPGVPYKDAYDVKRIHSITDYISRDGGQTFEKKFHYPTSIDSKRVKVLLADEIGPDGEPGIAKDGIIQLRRGVPDLSLGESRYSQVRILVDGDKYLKGMAIYSDNMPDGVDVIFNSNKKTVDAAYKKIKDDPDNPFGSAIKDADQGGQYWYDPKTGKTVTASTPGAKLGAINKRADEGDWEDWKDALPSQFLGKQSKAMAEKQLNLAKADKLAEFDEICSVNNPTIKKHLLEEFANNCDSAAVHLKAAALPGQKYHVIVPINSLKDNEIYAPRYENGTKLALIRYPHGGTFEIPILTVNNKHAAARNLLGTDVGDAVGINKKIADRLSGADFDGDTVMCIPTHDKAGRVKIQSREPLRDLEGFDPTEAYGPHTYEGRKVKLMSKKYTQNQMGVISNLITDMTLGGAPDEELAAAVRHSMVVIDAEKHKLDYSQSAKDNNISALHKKWQGKETGGASTILSRAKGEYSVPKRQGNPIINTKLKANGQPNKDYDPTKPEGSLIWKKADPAELYRPIKAVDKKTGIVTLTTVDGKKIKYDPNDPEAKETYRPIKKVNKETNEVIFTNKKGDITYAVEERTQKSTQMAEHENAYSLVSPARHGMELIYADYANSMKALANKARIEMVRTGNLKHNPEAKKAYSKEVIDLNIKLNEALLNAPRERAAARLANAEVKQKKDDGYLSDRSDEKKARQRAMTKYRDEVGAVARKKRNINITDREWEAIQAGAISESTLKKILNNTDIDKLRERATPRATTTLSTAKINQAKSMAASNYTLDQIAKKLGVSASTVSKYLKG